MVCEFTVLHLFAGIGGAALGFQTTVEEYRGMVGRFRTLAGIDVDPEACEDFEALTGAPAVQMDLFTRDDYATFHGSQPPAGWQETTAADILAAVGGEYPDVVFLSPPCKGFSGLLPKARSESPKYQALNNLVVRGLTLVLDAFAHDLPGVIMIENVPRITNRGDWLLRQVKHLLRKHGYLIHEGYHDCGELGGLAQHRRRYLLIARRPGKVTTFVYQPPRRRVKTISDAIGPLTMPDDPTLGPMHRLPRLQWKTWVRLALIPAGGDWRDLEKIAPEQYRLEYIPRGGGPFGVQEWEQPGATVVGNTSPKGSNATCIADPRTGFKSSTHHGIYRVQRWDKSARTITGAIGPNNGAPVIADPRRNGMMGACNIPGDREQGNWLIIALDGTWHRPLTTFELAVLQGFPLTMLDGRPLQLTGKSDARWRERIGNAVPPPAAHAIASQILRSLMLSQSGTWELSVTPIWVEPSENGRLDGVSNATS